MVISEGCRIAGTIFAQRVQFFEPKAGNENFLWVGVREGYLFSEKRYPSFYPYCVAAEYLLYWIKRRAGAFAD